MPGYQAPATAASSPERPSQFTAFTNPYFDTPTSIFTKIVNPRGREGVAPNAQTPGIKDTAATVIVLDVDHLQEMSKEFSES